MSIKPGFLTLSYAAASDVRAVVEGKDQPLTSAERDELRAPMEAEAGRTLPTAAEWISDREAVGHLGTVDLPELLLVDADPSYQRWGRVMRSCQVMMRALEDWRTGSDLLSLALRSFEHDLEVTAVAREVLDEWQRELTAEDALPPA